MAALLVSPLFAQIVQPVGRSHKDAQPLNRVAVHTAPALDRQAIAIDDTNRAANGDPARYAMPEAVTISPATHGTWQQLGNNWSLWRLRVASPGASHINLGFGTFQMPAGARMQVYSSNYQHIVRPFDAADHQPTGQLWTPVVMGDEIVCEAYVPTQQRNAMQLDLMQIGSGYRFFGAGPTALQTTTFGSGSCNIDVNCPQSAGWENEIAASAAISTGGGLFCSGSMINNTAQDGRNFFLTARHCGINSGAAPSLVCYWNYETANCGSGSAPLNQFTTGATWRADYSTSDFTLVELNSTPNPAWGVTYAGWNRGSGNASSAVAIHHPSGDSKKISFENQATQTTSYGGSSSPGNGSHVRVVDWDLGTTEGGSSGSPLFDQNHRIIGQLHGGGAACGNNLSDWYGRFNTSWTGGGSNNSRLSNWLDPIGTGATVLDTLGGGDLAAATPYGIGCYASSGSFAELFASNTFDLTGTAAFTRSIRLTPTAGNAGYTVANGPNQWNAPTTPDLNLSDDDIHQQALPWTFNYPGGSTNTIAYCTNGFAWLGTSTDDDYSPTIDELVNGAARLCPNWVDLNPNDGGTCHYQVIGNTAVFTWNNIPAYTAGTAGPGNTMQMVLYQNGQVDFRYRQFTNQPNDAVVGFTRGNTLTPPVIDLTTDLPLSVSTDADGLEWNALNRPILGTTQLIRLENITSPSQTIGLVVLGFQSVPGLDLGFIGAGGCRLYAQSEVIETLFPVTSSTALWSFAVPNNPSLTGTSLFTQGALLEPPTANALGARTANAVELKFGTL